MKLRKNESKNKPGRKVPAKLLAAALLSSTALAGCTNEVDIPSRCNNNAQSERADSYHWEIEPATQLDCSSYLDETLLFQGTVEVQVDDRKVGFRLVGLRPEPNYSPEAVDLAVRFNESPVEAGRITLETGRSQIVENGDVGISVKFVEMEHITIDHGSENYEGVCRSSWARFEIAKVCGASPSTVGVVTFNPVDNYDRPSTE